uniref:Uncharacterized protein n=1 Tax=Cucumis melo TaxID=3656 RepID=A0A9I9EF94_CUCME
LGYNVLIDSINKSIKRKKNLTALVVGIVGFVYSLLVWIYECIPLLIRLSIFYAQKVDDNKICMLNWVVDSHPKWKDLAEKVFNNDK